MVKSALAGLLWGVVWGVAARIWMRLITTDVPEFTWSGTLAIVVAAAVAGLAMGMVRGARKAARSRWWRLCAILALPIAMAPQGIVAFLPAFLLGGIALSGRLPALARCGLGAVTVAMPVVFALLIMSPLDRVGLPLATFITGLTLLQGGQAMGGAMLFGRWSDRPERVRRPGPLPRPSQLGHLLSEPVVAADGHSRNSDGPRPGTRI